MAIILTKIKYCYKMMNFSLSRISYLTYCVTTNIMEVWHAIYLDSSQHLQIVFPPGLFKKNHEKNSVKKFSV